MSSPIMTPPGLGGWTTSQLIELADRRTERRGSKTLDLNSEFLMALQTLCMELRWNWRRKTSIFQLKKGVWQYDLTQTQPYPASNAYQSQQVWSFSSAQRISGTTYLAFPPGATLPVLGAGETVYVLSGTSPTLNGPLLITQPPNVNLLANGGFESGLNAWTGYAAGLASAPTHTGNVSMQLAADNRVTVSYPVFTLTPGVAVNLSAWIYIASYAGASPVDVTFLTYDVNHNPVGLYSAQANTATIGSWQNVTTTHTPSSTEIYGSIYLQINSQFTATAQGSVQAFFDDISVLQGSTQYISNGGFETGWAPFLPGGVSFITAPVHSGSQAMQLSSSDPSVGLTEYTPIPLRAGVPTTLTGWVYVAQYAGTQNIEFAVVTHDSLGAVVNRRIAVANPTQLGVWQQVQVTFTPLSNEITGLAYCLINPEYETGTPGLVTAIFDDLSISTALVGTQSGNNVSTIATSLQDVIGLAPFPFVLPANAPDIQQFVKHGVRYYPNPGQPSQWGELTPMFERDLQSGAIYSNTYNPQPQPPRQYFITPFLVLNIFPLPDNDYPITIDYWAVPSFPLDSVPEQIPLVPAFLHGVLLKRLEAQIFRYTIGEGAVKYQAAMAEYSAMVAKYSAMDGMAPGEHIDWSADDDYESTFANAQNSVQSTT